MTTDFAHHLIVVLAIVTLFIALRPAPVDAYDPTRV